LLVAVLLISISLALVVGAFANVWAFDYSLTFKHFAWVGRRSSDLINSFLYAPAAALLGALLSFGAAFLVHAVRIRGRSGLDLVPLLPAAVPGTLLGVAYVLSFNDSPLKLTGSALIIIIAMTVGSLPIAYRVAAASFVQMRRSLYEAANDMGAGWIRSFGEI